MGVQGQLGALGLVLLGGEEGLRHELERVDVVARDKDGSKRLGPVPRARLLSSEPMEARDVDPGRCRCPKLELDVCSLLKRSKEVHLGRQLYSEGR